MLRCLVTLTLCAASQFALAQKAEDIAVNADWLARIKKSERMFLGKVCKLSDEQMQKADAFEGEHKAAVKQVGIVQNALGAIFRNGMENPTNPTREAEKKLRKSLQDKYKEILDDQQKELYEAELKARDEFKRRARGECLLALIEEKISIEEKQRGPLVESLSEWAEADNYELMSYFQYGLQNYFPPVPNRLYNKHLTPEQNKIIDSIQRVGIGRNDAMANEINW